MFEVTSKEQYESSRKLLEHFIKQLAQLREAKREREADVDCSECPMCNIALSVLNNRIKMTEGSIENLRASLAELN